MAKDVALFNILTNNLMSVAREMSADFLRSAYSVVIREAADCSTFLADAKGRILAQPQDQPLHMNSVSRALTGALSKVDVTNLTEDNAIILNDPYSGGQHQSDIYIFSPIVHNGKLVAFAGTTGHHADLGHSAGFNLHAKDIFEERFRFCPMVFSVSHDWNGGILEQVLRSNLRIPKMCIRDRQSLYNMLERNTDSYHHIPLEYKTEKEVLPHVKAHGQAFMPYSPMFQGLLSGKFKKDLNFSDRDIRNQNPKFSLPLFERYYKAACSLNDLAKKIGHPLNEISLNWLRQKPEVTSIIAGAGTPEELTENLHCLTWDLTEEMFAEIETIIAPFENI